MFGGLKAESQAVPKGARLVHIGPHKTGTTAIQGALDAAREELRGHGVAVPYRGNQPMREVQALTGIKGLKGVGQQDPRLWDKLVEDVRKVRADRVMISSEFFADAKGDTLKRVVDELGGAAVHVAVTLRPLAKVMPSQWQQYVQNGQSLDYGTWLDKTFNNPPDRQVTPTFWTRHRHDLLVERWAAAIGPERVTVVVVDESDPGLLLRAFEEMLALPAGLLRQQPDQANRSLTRDEVELVRRCNEVFKPMKDWPQEVYHTLFRHGAVMRMKTARKPGSDEPRIETPEWALDRAAELGAEMAEKIERSGVRIVGDLANLRARPAAREPVAAPHPTLTAAAAEGIAGVIEAVVAVRSGTGPIVASISGRDLARELARRIRRKVGNWPRD